MYIKLVQCNSLCINRLKKNTIRPSIEIQKSLLTRTYNCIYAKVVARVGRERNNSRRGYLQKKQEESLRDNVYVHYFDCSDGGTVYTYMKTYQIVHFKLLCN